MPKGEMRANNGAARAHGRTTRRSRADGPPVVCRKREELEERLLTHRRDGATPRRQPAQVCSRRGHARLAAASARLTIKFAHVAAYVRARCGRRGPACRGAVRAPVCD